MVLLYKLDRPGRDIVVTLTTIELLRSLGMRVECIAQSFDFDDPVDKLVATILSGVAKFERGTIVERSIAGINRLAREGAWTWELSLPDTIKWVQSNMLGWQFPRSRSRESVSGRQT